MNHFTQGTMTREELKGYPTDTQDGTNGIEINFVNGERDWVDPVLAIISVDGWTYYDNGFGVFGYIDAEIESREFYELEPDAREE